MIHRSLVITDRDSHQKSVPNNRRHTISTADCTKFSSPGPRPLSSVSISTTAPLHYYRQWRGDSFEHNRTEGCIPTSVPASCQMVPVDNSRAGAYDILPGKLVVMSVNIELTTCCVIL